MAKLFNRIMTVIFLSWYSFAFTITGGAKGADTLAEQVRPMNEVSQNNLFCLATNASHAARSFHTKL